MVHFALACSCLLAAVPIATDLPDRDDLEAYRAAAASVGRDADAHVRLALWCEAHGLEPERHKHLALAVLKDPGHAAARGLMGLLEDGGRWVRPEVVVARARDDGALAAKLDQYHKRRAVIPDTAEAHWQLARWCEENGLEVEALAHLSAVVRLNPAREEAWKKLGGRKQNGRWMTAAQVAEARAESEAQRRADAHWRPLLQKWKGGLARESHRAEAEAALAAVHDPRALPPIWRVFALGSPGDQGRAAVLLRQVDAPAAARGLASLAVTAATMDARRLAAEGLAGRDPREYAGLLIGLLREPVKFEVRQVRGPGQPGELYIQGEKVNRRRFYSAPPPLATLRPGDLVGFDDSGLPYVNRVVGYAPQPLSAAVNPLYSGAPDLTGAPDVLVRAGFGEAGRRLGQQLVHNQQQAIAVGQSVSRGRGMSMPLTAQIPVGQLMLQAQQQAELSRRRLEEDLAALTRYNEDVRQLNERATQALRAGLGEDLGPDRETWVKWWNDLSAISSAAPEGPRARERDPAKDQGAPTVPAGARRAWVPGFEEGTPVWARSGLRPVEDLRTGDQVLTQDDATGALGFAPVLTIRHGASTPVKAITLDDTEVVATELERFWVAGKGWVMARDLSPGDVVRVLGGVVRVVRVADAGARPVDHVQVPEGRGILVGRRGILAHDDGPARPVPTPFDSVSAPGAPRTGPTD